MKKFILASVVLSFLFAGCSKNDKNCDLNSTNLVGTYRTTAIKYKASTGSQEIDIFSSLEACVKDDLIIFNDNGTVVFQDAGSVCSPSGNDSGSWNLSGNRIMLDGEAGTVTSFECKTMVITFTETTGEVSTITLAKL